MLEIAASVLAFWILIDMLYGIIFAFKQITTDDLLQAAQIEERGMLDRKERSPETWKQVAINEAAMAVVAVNFPDLRNIEFVWLLSTCLLC